MKKALMFCIGMLSTSILLAQDVTDAVRYSMDEIQGTARFRAMGGAFGALGGDMSAVNINPAGSAIFNTSHASLTLGYFDKQDDITYFNGVNTASNSNVDVNQLGAAFVFANNNPNSPWKRFTLSAAFDRVADFDDDWIASGVNPNTSIVEYFFAFADGQRLDEISAFPGETISQAYSEIGRFFGFGNQQAFLGYEGFIIDPVSNTDDNTEYIRNISGSDFDQTFAYTSRGYNGKMAFNFATNYDDKFYFGVNLNAHFINFERTTFFSESNSNASSTVTNVNFDNNLLTTGSGFSFQLGGIAKLTEEFRVGLSYNSPTWYRISEETSQFLATTRLENGSSVNQIVNPNVTNIFPDYRLQTPGKITGSLAYVFGRTGLLSFDYSVKDYANAQFRPTSDVFFSALNGEINNTLTSASSYRFGGEYRYKQLSFRGGYRFEESPYQDNTFFGDLTGYSLGLGYTFGSFNLDLAFSQSERDINYQFFNVGLTDSALLQSKFTDIVLSLGFRI
ncbi:OmpP1/FadL family transporter [Winogradskyella tangerina]|uniref:OmpP1/FadL family transporter n=1 Tax=Winogradskyella tangerina TaxID=2023240 RepID=UPI000DBE79CA|nr:outer membrane protein transport protein [Winogradskyella tangerina]